MTKRPTDEDIKLYINDLELALADARAPVPVNMARFESVHGWAAEGPTLKCSHCGRTDHRGTALRCLLCDGLLVDGSEAL